MCQFRVDLFAILCRHIERLEKALQFPESLIFRVGINPPGPKGAKLASARNSRLVEKLRGRKCKNRCLRISEAGGIGDTPIPHTVRSRAVWYTQNGLNSILSDLPFAEDHRPCSYESANWGGQVVQGSENFPVQVVPFRAVGVWRNQREDAQPGSDGVIQNCSVTLMPFFLRARAIRAAASSVGTLTSVSVAMAVSRLSRLRRFAQIQWTQQGRLEIRISTRSSTS